MSFSNAYFTVVIPYSKTPTKWHPRVEGESLGRGAFPTIPEAQDWATTHLNGQPYTIQKHEAVS